jgi:hypothetical protein
VLMPLFQWMEDLAVYGSSPYIGPAVNLVHLLSMVTFAGGLLIVDLRLLGLGIRNQPLADVARDARPWLVGGLIGLTLTGIPQLAERATDQYETSIFWMKMYLLAFGVIWTFFVRNRVVRAHDPRGAWPKVVAIVSMTVWASVASLARLIMLLPANMFEFITG